MNISPTSCPICTSQRFELIGTYSKPDQYELRAGFNDEAYYRDWVRCSECSLAYSRYSRDTSLLDNLYINNYRSNSRQIFEKVIRLLPSESETKQRVNWILTNLEVLKHKPVNCLDIGGGSGVYAYEMTSLGYSCSIIDPFEYNHHLDTEYGLTVFREFLTSSTCLSFKYDLISMNFVLEHLPDPLQLLRTAKSHLAPQGYLYIEVPNDLSFDCRALDDDVFNSCHLTLFNLSTIKNLLDRLSLRIVAYQEFETPRRYMSLRLLCTLP